MYVYTSWLKETTEAKEADKKVTDKMQVQVSTKILYYSNSHVTILLTACYCCIEVHYFRVCAGREKKFVELGEQPTSIWLSLGYLLH